MHHTSEADEEAPLAASLTEVMKSTCKACWLSGDSRMDAHMSMCMLQVGQRTSNLSGVHNTCSH